MGPVDFFDRYDLLARIAPALITIASMSLLLAAIIPWQHLRWFNVIGSLLGSSIVLIIVLYLMADLARQRGHAIEPGLITQMGGLPSTTMMRYSDSTLDSTTKEHLHKFLSSKLNIKAPTVADEASDPAAADQFYTSGANWLRENTRDHKKFNILFNENINFGFHRNLLGLKPFALVLDILVVGICSIWLMRLIWLGRRFRAITLFILIAIAALHAAYFGFAVTQQSAIDAARIYARQLILSFEAL